MKTKKIPLRTCVVTKEKNDKRDMLRIVKDKDGNIFVDPSGKANGKGAYITKDINVLEKAKKNKILDKVFEVNIDDSIYEKIKEYI